MKYSISAFLLLFILASCGKEAKKDKVAELEAEVMTIHDEVMPQMDAIMTLKSQLSKKIQSMDSLQNEGISSNTIAEERIKAVDLNQKLNESDKLMMSWMHGYRGDSAKKLAPENAVAYFESEKEKILQVKQVTIKSIQEAKTFLE
ncbi:viral A-type inclusion protein [Dyadobacter sp. CY326]|uniref:viral A-type inclusion protein n=1 Tax=Dyadobacter sp. CY326 TaxID=2907300 RepID=UPI001F16EDB3|nr:viral A-type inclusion protein [Dyadobacter sp. CY326]MCE7066702.1 viral A-type inclusion protein [Dyadobacter sp. CY326]